MVICQGACDRVEKASDGCSRALIPQHRKQEQAESKCEVSIMGDGTETADFASFRVMCLDEDQLQSTVFKRQQGGGRTVI